MRILMLNYEFPPLGGGAANANYYLLRELAKYDDVTVDFVTSSPSGYREEAFTENVTIYKLNVEKDAVHHWTQQEILRYSWKAYRLSRRLSKENEYGLVHAWFSVPSGAIARLLGLPYLVGLRGSDVPGYNERFSLQYKILTPLIKRIWRDAETVIANSEGLRELARETSPIKIDVIPNGIDVTEFTPRYTESDALNVLCVARLVKRKGIRYLIDAATELEVNVTIVGDGTRKEQLEAHARKQGVTEKVTFVGRVPHEKIARYYERADVFVLPSLNEGMSNTVLEAMAAGLPVITTDTGGTAELLDGNGIVVPMKDATAIADAINSYTSDPDKIREHGERSRRIAEIMSWERVTQQYVEAYVDICSLGETCETV